MSRRALGAAVGILALAVVVYGGSGLLRVWRMRQEVQALEREIAVLRGQNRDLARTVDRLRSDPAEIERIAREDLGFVRPGEKVLKFPPSVRTLP